LRGLIRRMSGENPLWGAPRIHGELLKLGFKIAESTVSKYMIRRRGPPSQTWRTFLRSHAEAIAAIDLCVVPTLTFERLFAFLVLGHGRRQLLWFAVTRNPTPEWLAQQIVQAFPWNTAPTYLVRDNDRAYGSAFTRRLRAMGIRDRPTSPRSPWQNPCAERLIGTLRRVLGSCSDLQRAASAADPGFVFGVLQSDTRALGIGQGCAATASCPRIGNYCWHTHSVRIAPPLRADMIFGNDRGVLRP
jgi:transposase InsO family protein